MRPKGGRSDTTSRRLLSSISRRFCSKIIRRMADGVPVAPRARPKIFVVFFADSRAIDITEDRLNAYIVFRQQEHAANATINRELAALKRAFRLAGKKVGQPPRFPMLRENNARKGFFEAEQFKAVLQHLPDHLKSLFEVAYITGWRVSSELLTRKWQHVDLENGWLRLDPGESKNTEGRCFRSRRNYWRSSHDNWR